MIIKQKKYAFFLLFIIIFPSFFYLISFNFQKQIIRSRVNAYKKKYEEKTELVLLKFSEAEAEKSIVWIKKHEFLYNNQMYDIFETYSRNDTTFYLCWKDDKETKLIKKHIKLITKTKNNNSDKNTHRINLLFQNFYFEKSNFIEKSNILCFELFFTYFFNISSYNLIPDSPPPKK